MVIFIYFLKKIFKENFSSKSFLLLYLIMTNFNKILSSIHDTKNTIQVSIFNYILLHFFVLFHKTYEKIQFQKEREKKNENLSHFLFYSRFSNNFSSISACVIKKYRLPSLTKKKSRNFINKDTKKNLKYPKIKKNNGRCGKLCAMKASFLFCLVLLPFSNTRTASLSFMMFN